ncbi:MAG: hypothetical protein EBV29_06440 [Gammaproteobacteria bacterium]|nr:hypothetical protein [Gammaproteobacteria bacterium]
MIVGSLLRNLDDVTSWLKIPQTSAANAGMVCLTLFLTIALMNLKLWELAALALPLLVNLVLQLIAVALVCWWLVFRVMGRDYDAIVMTGGFTGSRRVPSRAAAADLHAALAGRGRAGLWSRSAACGARHPRGDCERRHRLRRSRVVRADRTFLAGLGRCAQGGSSKHRVVARLCGHAIRRRTLRSPASCGRSGRRRR